MARRNTYQLVADAIATAIQQGRLVTGDQLPSERELTLAYRVGRSTVREAVRVLESQGLVAPDTRGGFQVGTTGRALTQALRLLVELDQVEISDLFAVRRTLEVESAGLAAARRSDSDLVRLETDLEEMEAGLDLAERYNAGDLAFHLDLARASGNRLTARLMESIREVMSRAFEIAFRVPGSARLSLAEHRAITAAVEARDPALAQARMGLHLSRVELDTIRAGRVKG
ncbi:MAG: FadR/GntR family transcriptional regulator [Candidatus Dormibacteria bacterium]